MCTQLFLIVFFSNFYSKPHKLFFRPYVLVGDQLMNTMITKTIMMTTMMMMIMMIIIMIIMMMISIITRNIKMMLLKRTLTMRRTMTMTITMTMQVVKVIKSLTKLVKMVKCLNRFTGIYLQTTWKSSRKNFSPGWFAWKSCE